MDAIGIRIAFVKQKWPELNRMANAGQLMMWGLGTIGSIPDADAFYTLLYSGNIGTSNYARFRLPEFDRLYEQSQSVADPPQRIVLFRKMNDADPRVRTVDHHAPLVQQRHRATLAAGFQARPAPSLSLEVLRRCGALEW